MDFDGCCSLSKMRIEASEAMKTRLVATNHNASCGFLRDMWIK